MGWERWWWWGGAGVERRLGWSGAFCVFFLGLVEECCRLCLGLQYMYMSLLSFSAPTTTW